MRLLQVNEGLARIKALDAKLAQVRGVCNVQLLSGVSSQGSARTPLVSACAWSPRPSMPRYIMRQSAHATVTGPAPPAPHCTAPTSTNPTARLTQQAEADALIAAREADPEGWAARERARLDRKARAVEEALKWVCQDGCEGLCPVCCMLMRGRELPNASAIPATENHARHKLHPQLSLQGLGSPMWNTCWYRVCNVFARIPAPCTLHVLHMFPQPACFLAIIAGRSA